MHLFLKALSICLPFSLLAGQTEIPSVVPRPSPARTINRNVEKESLIEGQSDQERTTLTGDWGGARKTLLDHGVNISAYYADDCLGNPVGGKRKGFANAATLEVDAFFDFDKMAGATGLGLFASFVYRFGTNLSAKSIGNQFNAAEVYGGESYRLNELYIRESLYDERWVMKAGRLDAGNDFIASPLYTLFVSNAFDSNPVGILYNVPFKEDPFATWAAFLKFVPVENLVGKFAVYNNNTDIYSNEYHGTNFTFHSTDGVLLITEWAYLVNQSPKSHGMPGNYKVGYYYSTGHADKFLGGSQRGNFGYYFTLDQMIYHFGDPKEQRGITPFTALLFAPKNRNTFPFFFVAGIVNKGFIPSRKDDSLSFGIAHGDYSSDLRRAEKLAKRTGLIGMFGDRPQTAETVLELSYWAHITKWMAIIPDTQYIINPKGYGKIQNAFVMGLQLYIEI